MVLVFVLLAIISLLIIIILISSLKINIKKLELSNETENSSIIKEFTMSIGLYAFNKIKIFNKNINKQDLEKMKNSEKMKQMKDKFMNKETMKEKKQDIKTNINVFKQLKIRLQQIDLKIKLGTEDVVLTSFLICLISIIISMLLSKAIKKYNEEKYKYKIIPNYDNKNSVNIILNGIIDIKLVNIISVLFKLLFRRNELNERTSNRRAYANCNGQYTGNGRCKYNYRGTN